MAEKNYYHLHLRARHGDTQTIIHIGSFECEEAFENAKKKLINTLIACDKRWWAEYHAVGSIFCWVTFED